MAAGLLAQWLTPTADSIGDFLRSREGKALQKKVMRGVFGMLKKRL